MIPRLLHVTTVPMTLHFVAGHVAEARRRGFEVHVLSSPGTALDAFAREQQVTAHAVPMARRIAPLSDLVSLGRIAHVVRRLRPAIVDAHTPKGGLLAMMAATLYAAHCTDDSPLFIAAWYSLAIAFVTVVGAVIGSRALRW